MVLRCRNNSVHKTSKVGNILFVCEDNYIYAKCTDQHCKRWTRIKLSIPGINLDFKNIGFEQKLMPKDFKFKIDKTINDIERAPVIIEA